MPQNTTSLPPAQAQFMNNPGQGQSPIQPILSGNSTQPTQLSNPAIQSQLDYQKIPYSNLQMDMGSQMQEAHASAYQQNPLIQKGFLEALSHQESGMGTNPANQNTDAGKFGWLTGITRTGRFQDMQSQMNKFDSLKAIPQSELQGISSPRAAIGLTASMITQAIQNHYGGKPPSTPDGWVNLYDKYYKTQLGAPMTSAIRTKFKANMQHYSKYY